MQNLQLYMLEPDLLTYRTVIKDLGTIELNKTSYGWVKLEKTIFHPKGGGQPPDVGTINGVQVLHAYKDLFDPAKVDAFDVMHCFDPADSIKFKIGDEVELIVDPIKRHLHSRVHSGGHALADAVTEHSFFLEAYQGNHAPNDSYVKFKNTTGQQIEKTTFIPEVQEELNAWIAKAIPVTQFYTEEKGFRSIQIGAHTPVGCGGTHVKNLSELGNLIVKDVSINNKEHTITVKYAIN